MNLRARHIEVTVLLSNSFLLINSGSVHAFEAMAVDEYCLQYLKENPDINGIIRFYTWNRPAISIGYFQKCSLLDLSALAADKVQFVRRPTGGNAIYHADDFSYAVTVQQGRYGIVDRASFYITVARIIQHALHALGIEVDINMEIRNYANNPDCFKSISQYEIVDRQGVKVTGAAQRIDDGIFLQQGTFFTKKNRLGLGRYLLSDQIKSGCGGMNEGSGILDHLAAETVLTALVDAFFKTWQVEPFVFDRNSIKAIDRLVESKYATDKWNRRR